MLSALFQVSTDYLLKDEMEEDGNTARDADCPETPAKRSVSLEEANAYMELTRKYALPNALAVALFVLCPVPLLLLAGLAEAGRLAMTDEMAGGVGVVILLAMVAVGVTVLILCGRYTEPYGFLNGEVFTLQYGVEGITKKNKEMFAGRFHTMVAVGVALCVLGAVPLLILAAMEAQEYLLVFGVALLLLMVAMAVSLFVWAGSIQDSFHKLLQSGDFSPARKAASKKLGAFSGAYWCIVTAVFLVVFTDYKYSQSFFFDVFGNNKNPNIVFGMIWGVAALLFAAIRIVLNNVMVGKGGNGTD